ncbi:hypothetical protein Pcinc_026095 [Petrolisthes cinctipes]|uniref:Uncharacterized protein n=1 Tax=Petrolisthes cinctipes TaxID=88211 RepID=A0AAE1F7Y2_PETCI|nr:hypothetical protein Pcinc_026095 [Petrolisthes cinctipes]
MHRNRWPGRTERWTYRTAEKVTAVPPLGNTECVGMCVKGGVAREFVCLNTGVATCTNIAIHAFLHCSRQPRRPRPSADHTCAEYYTLVGSTRQAADMACYPQL